MITTIRLPADGYAVRTRETTVRRELAPYVLTRRIQIRTTKAVRTEESVILSREYVLCPACGEETPLYGGRLCDTLPGFQGPLKTFEEIDAWSTGQVSFTGEQPAELVFHGSIDPPLPEFRCPRCGRTARNSSRDRAVSVESRKGRIIVRMDLETADIFDLNWVKRQSFKDPEMGESLTFDLKTGHTFLTLDGKDGTRIETRDLSGTDLSDLTDDPVVRLVDRFKPVSREVKRLFQPHWNGFLPFSGGELNVERYALLTRFVGFDRTFYRSVPMLNTENRIEKSFARAAKELHRASDVPDLVKNAALPEGKSVRRILFSEPSLLFYRDELERLWAVLGDVNYFRRLLQSRSQNIYRTLAFLHRFPSAAVYLTDLREQNGPAAVFRDLGVKRGSFGASFCQIACFLTHFNA